MPIVVVVGRDRPHEVALNVWAIVIGVLLTFGAPRPGSMAALVGGGTFYVFSVGLGLGGLIALIGSHWGRDVERSLEIERAGLIILAGALLVYAVAVTVTFRGQALVAGGLVTAWVWANIRRSVIITRDLQRVKRKTGLQ
ncbi:hypothetical protein [Paractinoplanes toevensis]|uniref:Uncharacterized protein n=1 Tax=Paractinoplanes toevensis TaxID=571911 RepID=A0A919W038_9ACTN|nr:hypothetical protein [Actinoplanes toevensis]GIM88744.1 hypothetical protein Ato02nite_005370 [Actinoplanes toevensis]